MKITDVRTVDVCVPLSTHGKHEPVTMWYGTRYAALKTIIFIDTDEGITGLGEEWAPAAGTVQCLAPSLIGQDPFDRLRAGSLWRGPPDKSKQVSLTTSRGSRTCTLWESRVPTYRDFGAGLEVRISEMTASGGRYAERT